MTGNRSKSLEMADCEAFACPFSCACKMKNFFVVFGSLMTPLFDDR
jgi:hypothetical protein